MDLFGGSGLLSHTVKSEKPNAKVIYNDFDNFKQRLESIKTTNYILEQIRPIVASYKKNTRLSVEDKNEIFKIIEKQHKKGFVDFVTLSANILFSMNYANSIADLKKEHFYAKVRKSNYEVKDYLSGVEIVKDDYKNLFDKYAKNPNVVFLVDPPYLSTDCTTYSSHKYWKLKDYLDVLTILHKNNYFYFTSNKSSIVELCEWIATNTNYQNPFKGSKIVYQYNTTTHNSGYTDIMLHRYTTTTTL